MLWQTEDSVPNPQQIEADSVETERKLQTGRIITVMAGEARERKTMMRMERMSARRGERADSLLPESGHAEGKRKVHLQELRWQSVFAVCF